MFEHYRDYYDIDEIMRSLDLEKAEQGIDEVRNRCLRSIKELKTNIGFPSKTHYEQNFFILNKEILDKPHILEILRTELVRYYLTCRRYKILDNKERKKMFYTPTSTEVVLDSNRVVAFLTCHNHIKHICEYLDNMFNTFTYTASIKVWLLNDGLYAALLNNNRLADSRIFWSVKSL